MPLIRRVLTFVALSALAFGCRTEPSAADFVLVPELDKIPYYDRPSLPVTKETRQYVIGSDYLPPSVAAAKGFLLGGRSRYELRPTGLALRSDYSVAEIDATRILVLDKRSRELFEYNFESGSTNQIARAGDGPGELQWLTALKVADRRAYVSRSDRKISVFDCLDEPCTFEKQIGISAPAGAIAIVSPDTFAVKMGSQIPMTGEISAEMPSVSAVTLTDSSGAVLSAFGETYDIGGHWMLDRELIRNATIDYDASSASYLTATARFPFLYALDADGSLTRMYRIQDFVLGRQRYFPLSGALEIVMEDFSRIASVAIFDRSLIVLNAQTLRNQREQDQSWVYDATTDYYLIDLSTNETDYLGSLSGPTSGPSERLIMLPSRLMLEQGGELFEVVAR